MRSSPYIIRLIVTRFKIIRNLLSGAKTNFYSVLTRENNETLMGHHALLVCSHHNVKHMTTGPEGFCLDFNFVSRESHASETLRCTVTLWHHRFCFVARSEILAGNNFVVSCHVTSKYSQTSGYGNLSTMDTSLLRTVSNVSTKISY